MPRLLPTLALILCALLLAACGSPAATAIAPTLPGEPTATAAPQSQDPAATNTPLVNGFYIQPGVPAAIATFVIDTLTAAGYMQVDAPESARLRVILDPTENAALTTEYIYAVAAPFPTVRDAIAWGDLIGYWAGGAQPSSAPYSPASQFLMTDDVRAFLETRLGPLSATPNTIASTSEIADTLWAQSQYAIIPFEALEPRLKVMSIDGATPLDKAMDTTTYPLTARVGVMADDPAAFDATALLQQAGWPATNRDPAKMTVLVMTGVTALSRAVAMSIQTWGYDYPAREIMPFFTDADILHTSNEASFDPACPPPDWYGDPVFCEHRSSFELLRHIGLDIVELTGNHNLDYGIGPAINSLDVYDNEQLPYYGGGRNLDDAYAARILTAPDGTRIAFIGCNSAGPYGAWATASTPGAAPCDDWSRIRQSIADLKSADQADLVVATLQHTESDSYIPIDQQRTDFEALSAAGADIVSGSQAHQPQGFTFVDGRFVHFGVGNLFFDQIDLPGNRQMFADKHILYEGRHISTILFTGWFEEVAQPRPMTPEERIDFLQLIFQSSGW